MHVRRPLAGGVMVLSVAGLTSCTVPSVGAVGVMRNGSTLSFVVATCSDAINLVELVRDTQDPEDPGVATWNVTPGYTSPVVISFAADGPNARIDRRGSLDGDTRCYVHGATTDDTFSASGISFTPSELLTVRPGQVLVDGWLVGSGDSNRQIPLAWFQTAVCFDYEPP